MSLEEFDEPEMNTRQKGYVRMRSIMDMGMGLLWLSMGLFLVFIEKFNTGLEARFNDPAYKIFGGLCIVYGLFRIYRGLKKDYYRRD